MYFTRRYVIRISHKIAIDNDNGIVIVIGKPIKLKILGTVTPIKRHSMVDLFMVWYRDIII